MKFKTVLALGLAVWLLPACEDAAEEQTPVPHAVEPLTAVNAVSANAVTGGRVVDIAVSLKGKVQYAHAYDPVNLRLDCSGFTYEVYRRAGLNLGTRDDDKQALLGKYVPREEIQKGDLVFFWNEASVDKNDVGHVGIYVGNGRYIHNANKRSNVIVSYFNSAYAKERYITARRIIF